LLDDCRLRSLDPFRIEVTGVDPQLHLPPFAPATNVQAVHIRLRVTPTLPAALA